MFNWLPIGGAIGRKMLYGPAVCGRWIIVFGMSDSPLLSLAALVALPMFWWVQRHAPAVMDAPGRLL